MVAGCRADGGIRGADHSAIENAIPCDTDSVLSDEARTPLILAEKGDIAGDPDMYAQALSLSAQLGTGPRAGSSCAPSSERPAPT